VKIGPIALQKSVAHGSPPLPVVCAVNFVVGTDADQTSTAGAPATPAMALSLGEEFATLQCEMA
jgi:hypothetical protein